MITGDFFIFVHLPSHVFFLAKLSSRLWAGEGEKWDVAAEEIFFQRGGKANIFLHHFFNNYFSQKFNIRVGKVLKKKNKTKWR